MSKKKDFVAACNRQLLGTALKGTSLMVALPIFEREAMICRLWKSGASTMDALKFIGSMGEK